MMGTIKLLTGSIIAGIGLFTVFFDLICHGVDFDTEKGLLNFLVSSLWLIGGLIIIFL